MIHAGGWRQLDGQMHATKFINPCYVPIKSGCIAFCQSIRLSVTEPKFKLDNNNKKVPQILH